MTGNALNRLKQGWSREQVLDELRRFIVKDNAVQKDGGKSGPMQTQKSNQDKGLVFSAEETKMLRTVRRVVPVFGYIDYEVASIVEKRLIRLFLMFSGQFQGRIRNYIPLFLQRVTAVC